MWRRAGVAPRRLRLQGASPFSYTAAGRLLRIRTTVPQVGNDRLHRWQNVKGAFEWRGPQLSGRSVIVVDDVATTGATLEACASALNEGGAGPVIGVTVARVRI